MSRRNKVSIGRGYKVAKKLTSRTNSLGLQKIKEIPSSTMRSASCEQHHRSEKSIESTEERLDVRLSLDRSASQVKPLSQQNLGVAGRCQCRFRNPRNLKIPDRAFCEVSRRTFSGTVNRNHASEGKFSSRNVANSLSRDVFASSVFQFLFSARRKIESFCRSQIQFFFTGACFHASRNPFMV